MKNLKHKIISTFLALSMLCTMNLYSVVSVSAEPIEDNALLNDKDFVEAVYQNKARGNLLDQGVARLSNLENGEVNAYGAAMAYKVCDRVTVELTVQKYIGGDWYDYSRKTFEENNVTDLSKSYKLKVDGGYYYRLQALCVVEKDGIIESQLPITDGLYIKK